MTRIEIHLTANALRDLLAYEPLTGTFLWRVGFSNGIKVGDVAGSKTNQGYLRIRVLGRQYQAHRLAWLHTHGEWPVADIDHIDGDHANNAIANLRDVARGINMQNQRRARSNNTSGFLGVSPNGSGWIARIKIDGRYRYLGTFSAPADAGAAYIEAKRIHHPGNTL